MVGFEADGRLKLVEAPTPPVQVDILVAQAAPVVGGLPLPWKLVALVGKCLSRCTYCIRIIVDCFP